MTDDLKEKIADFKDSIKETPGLKKNAYDIYTENPGKILIGVINIATDEIFLFPAIPQKVEFVLDSNGQIKEGWLLKKIDGWNERGAKLSSEELKPYIDQYESGNIPRNITNHRGKKFSAHSTVISIIGGIDRNFRGFCVIPGKPDKYLWTSYSLNGGQTGEMDLATQQKVKKIINTWSAQFELKTTTTAKLAAKSLSSIITSDPAKPLVHKEILSAPQQSTLTKTKSVSKS